MTVKGCAVCAFLMVSLSTAHGQTGGNAGQALTLADCYRLALARSETVAQRREVVKETKGIYLAALGSIVPQVTFSGIKVRQHFTTTTQVPTYFAAEENDQDGFRLTQVIFSGFKEYAALSAGKSLVRQRTLEEIRSEQVLLSSVTTAFFTAAEMRDQVRVLNDVRTLIQERIDDLKARVAVGRSQKSDVLSATVLYYNNEADANQAQGQEEDARRQLEFLTGVRVGELNDTQPMLSGIAGTEESYAEKSRSRPDVKAAQHAYEAALKQVTVARAAFYPSVNFTYDYYTNATGRYGGVDWEASVTLDVPLLPVVQVLGSVRQASAQAREAQLQSTLTERTAVLEARNGYRDLKYAIDRWASYEDALSAAEDNYKTGKQEYRLRLISNLDFLQVLVDLQTARKNYLHSVYDVKRAYWTLRAAAGEGL